MEKDTYSLSIDIGTTNTVAFIHDGRIRQVDVDDYSLFPSVVQYCNDGTIKTGVAARNAMSNYKNIVVANSKRCLGVKIEKEDIEKYEKLCGVKIQQRSNRIVYYLKNVNKYVTPEEIISILVTRVLERANKLVDGNKKLAKIVITHPANFNNDQKTSIRNAVYDVVKAEGIRKNEIHLLSEPAAAAYCYGVDNQNSIQQGTKILIYDFGGGTFDASLLQINNGIISAIDHDGDTALGGSDCDKAIAQDLLDIYKQNFGMDLMARVPKDNQVQKFRSVASKACSFKQDLSNSNEVDVLISDLFMFGDSDDDEKDSDFTYSRGDMNRVISPLIHKTMEVVDRLLERNNCRVDDIQSVILVGGSSNLRLVSDLLDQKFGKKILSNIDANNCVAEGGLKFLLNQNLIAHGKKLVVDTIPFSLGIEVENQEVCWLIPRNSKIPFTYSDYFITTKDNQDFVDTSLLQGKGTKSGQKALISESDIRLSKIRFNGFTKKPKGQVEFKIEYSYTECGIVHIKVLEMGKSDPLYDNDIEF